MISQEVSNECYGFLFWECRYKRKKFRLRSLVGHGYVSLNVTQQNSFEMFVIFFQRHLLGSQRKFVECVSKKMLKEFSKFCNNVVCFMICYSCYEVSSLQAIFSIFCIPTFMDKKMRKWYSLNRFEVGELLPLPLSWEIRFLCTYLCGE